MDLSTTIIIPSLNSPIIDRVVAKVLDQIQGGADLDIIVVGIDDAGLLPVKEGVTFIDTGEPILAAVARNRGIEASDADIFVFLDSDCIPEAHWLSEHLAAQKSGHRVVSGGIIPAGENYWHLAYNLTLFHEVLSVVPAGPRDFLATLNLSVHRSVIDTVGEMNEEINRVEDVDWTTRMRKAGIQPYFWPKAEVYHDHNRRSMADVWRDCALSGYHMRRLRLEHSGWLRAPGILKHRRLVLLLSPLIAAWATLRILFKRPVIIRRFFATIPAIYLTKIAWCWGASRESYPALRDTEESVE
jgi:GT2 family glycosyltransferase